MPAWRGRPGNAAVASSAPPFALLLVIAWGLAAGQLLALGWDATALSLNDTDDAMRLVQMRAFLDGKGWFDLHEARAQPPLGYDTHWSRLIDAGLSGLVLLFRFFMDPALAERVTRAVWPLIWLLSAISGAAAIAWRLAGREAALVALLFAVFGFPLFQQFVPGRIDHHNVQIAVAVTTLAAMVWSDRLPWTAGLAGMLAGFGLAIGLEALPYLGACGAALVVRYVLDPNGEKALRFYALTLVAATVIAFVISVPPDRWSVPACDALAINLLAGILIGAGTLTLVAARAPARVHRRGAWALGWAVTALAVAVWLEPRCLAGPFAMMDPAVWPIWLSQVSEMQPMAAILRETPLLALTTLPFLSAAFAAAAVLATDPQGRRDFAVVTTAAMLVLAAATTFATVKTLSYALWFGMPLVTVLALNVCEKLRVARLVPRFLVALLLTPFSFAAAGLASALVAGIDTVDVQSKAATKACFATANYESLGQLPAGLVFADVDVGPFMLALTPHVVMATPYHRAGDGILLTHNLLAVPPATARALFDQAADAYVLTCGPRGPVGLDETARSASLWGQLQAGNVPEWLERIPEPGQPFNVYRLKP